MPWDKDFAFDPIDGETPPELLAAIEKVLLDDELRLESITLARKKRDSKTAKPSSSYVKWSAYVVDGDQTAEEICAVLIGGAYACADSDGDLGVNKYEATIVWTIRATAKKDRARPHFELDEGRRMAPRHTPAPSCPACAAYRDAAEFYKSDAASLRRELTSARDKAEAAIKVERDARDKIATELQSAREKFVAEMLAARDKLANDYAKIGTEAAKDARECYKPTEHATSQILGMLGAAIQVYEGAIEARGQQADAAANERAKQQRGELAKQSLAMVEKLALKIVAGKYGSKDDKAEGEQPTKETTMDKLKKLRDDLFKEATDNDWRVLGEHAGSEFVDKIKTMREGEIDIVALDDLFAKFNAETSAMQKMQMLTGLSDPLQLIVMALIDVVPVARKEAGK